MIFQGLTNGVGYARSNQWRAKYRSAAGGNQRIGGISQNQACHRLHYLRCGDFDPIAAFRLRFTAGPARCRLTPDFLAAAHRQNGGNFFLYKFRTLQAPFDSHGQPVSEEQRFSWVGRLLRKTRLDELPQLFNVLVGDMALIGPRPLLPCDQPMNSTLRLTARPGITGWAQVNGGNLITADEKGVLDDWYVSNASLRLDMRVLGLTLLFLIRGERRSERALAQAPRSRLPRPWKAAAHPRRTVREEVGSAINRGAMLRVQVRRRPMPVDPHPDQSDRNKDF